MGCGCSKRLQKMLTILGYRRRNGVWKHPSGDSYTDYEVRKHHTQVAVEIARKKVTGKI